MESLVCIECALPASGSAKAWHGHLVDLDDDGRDEVVFYCPLCAEHEFGRLSSADAFGVEGEARECQ